MTSSGESRGRASLMLVVGAAAVVFIALTLLRQNSQTAGDPVAATDTTRHNLIAGGGLELSGVAHVPGSNQILVLDDDTPGEIFLVEVGPDTTQLGDAVPVSLGISVRDMEGITFDGESYYVVGSQSKESGFEGPGLVRLRYDPQTRSTSSVEAISGLKAWLADNVAELAGTAQQIGDHVLNIEALAWDPGGRRLLLGLRAPVVDGRALVVPVKLIDPQASFTRENLRADGPAVRIDLRGDGIRSLEFDGESDTYRVISGASLNDETSDFRIFEWDGRSEKPSREIAVYSRKLKPEGITNAEMFGKRLRVIVFDIGTFLLSD